MTSPSPQSFSPNIWKKILDDLSPADIPNLHVSSRYLFSVCSDFLKEGKKLCIANENFQKVTIDETEQNLNSQSTTLNDIRKEFLSDIKYGQRHLWDKYFTLTLNIHD